MSVRATNERAVYATLPNSVRIGDIYALWGQGQAGGVMAAQGGSNVSWFQNLWGAVTLGSSFTSGTWAYLLGPSVTGNFVPAQSLNYAGDRFGVTGTGVPLSEGTAAFDQTLSNAFNNPVSLLYPARDGVGFGVYSLGNAAATQTVGAGDGSTSVWCSQAMFCATAGVSPAGPLVFGAGSLTGAWFSGASISGTTFSAGTRIGGALQPGMVLNTPNAPTLVMCLTGCSSGMEFGGSTWLLSTTDTVTPTRADPIGGAPWPSFNIQQLGAAVYGYAGFGWSLIQAGTFTVKVNGTVVCQDSQTFAYNQTGGNCTGAGISGFVNYQTGDYQINFTSPPASGASIIASWTNVVSPQTVVTQAVSRPQGFDYFGNGSETGGPVSSQFARFPGGVTGHIFSAEGTDSGYYLNSASGEANPGYQFGGVGYSQMVSWLFDTRFPNTIPGGSANTQFLATGFWRVEGPSAFGLSSNVGSFKDGISEQLSEDMTTPSVFSGTVSGSVLTLTSSATGPMWEGEILGCVTYNATTCPIGPLSGAYITGLASGAWGASGSTYNLSVSPGNFTNQALQNAVFYSGPGAALYLGALNDIDVQQTTGLAGTIGRSPHIEHGFVGGRRATSRWAAMIWEASAANPHPATGPNLASDPQNDRTKADAGGCDSASTAAPCFDIGNTYAAVATPTAVSGKVLTFNGLSAHARPIVPGQNVSCSGCSGALVVQSVSNPPTQSTVAGQGQVGSANNGFTVTLAGSGTLPGGTPAYTFGCSGVSGTGSSCIDIAISINVGGTFVTAAALATCGANNLNGNAPNYIVPNGVCQDNGIGALIRAFHIGTNQTMSGTGQTIASGSVLDDGIDFNGGFFTQSSAFTCNIVAAKVVQCVKGPLYTSGVWNVHG